MKHPFPPRAHALRTAASLARTRLARCCRHAWHTHQHLLRNNPGYAAALAALAATLVTRTELPELLAALLAGALAIYRALTSSPDELEN